MERSYPESNPHLVIGEPRTFMGDNLQEIKASFLGRLALMHIQQGDGIPYDRRVVRSYTQGNSTERLLKYYCGVRRIDLLWIIYYPNNNNPSFMIQHH